MDVMQAIHTRRTIYDFHPSKEVSAELLEHCLEAGRWGQNHKLTEPWRFTVVGAQTRERMAQVLVELKLQKSKEKEKSLEKLEKVREKAEKAGEKLRQLGALVVVSMVRTPGDMSREREDYAAVATGVQNVSLALWAEGVGMQWGTGEVTRDPRTYEILGIDAAAEEIVAFLKIGYPKEIPEPRRRPWEDVLRRLP